MPNKESDENMGDEENNILAAIKEMKLAVVEEPAASASKAKLKKMKLVVGVEPGQEPG